MIVEVLGPPGVGKTTFAAALTSFLRDHNASVDPVMSYRPAELQAGTARASQGFASVRRLARPVAAAAQITGEILGHSPGAETTAELLRLLPPKSLMWSIRLRQYLVRLFHSWRIAEESSGVVVFDQAFVQGVCSLALLARAPSRAKVELALDTVPEPDVLIALQAPRDLLASRLQERQRRQGRIEQMLELDLQSNLASIEIIDDLLAMLRARGTRVISVQSVDRHTLQAGVAEAGAMVLARRDAAIDGIGGRAASARASWQAEAGL